MAVGGGDAFSLSATLLTIILLWSFIQWTAPWWLHEISKRNSIDVQRIRQLDRALTLLPLVLLFAVMTNLIFSHITLDYSNAHVANFGGGHLSIIERIFATMFSEEGPWLAIPLSFAISSIICEYFCGNQYHIIDGGISFVRRSSALRLHGFLWPFMLVAYLSSESFAVYSIPQPVGESTLIAPLYCIFQIISGASLAVWIYFTSRLSQESEIRPKQIYPVLISGLFSIMPIIVSLGVYPNPIEGPSLSHFVALEMADSLALCISLGVLLIGWPLFLYILSHIHSIRGQARERKWLGLLFIFSHTLIITWISGVVILETLPNVSGWDSAMWLALTLMLPLSVVGLIGTLLPMAGFDARPRPEIWGFYLMTSLLIPFLTIKYPLTAALAPGLFISMVSSPLLATHVENRPSLLASRRVIESLVIVILSIIGLYCLHQVMTCGILYMLGAIVIIICIPLSTIMFTNSVSNEIEIGEEE
ncbi:MAG: hypothetical protein CMO20_06545 [Thermoplasmata archaeon]|nr:hypothetical protein [Thermoplasmata archaeon]|tara:strand:- start:2094 stop:3521 length:1428 start_codon:yes stop_codon:yes gene_type:complete